MKLCRVLIPENVSGLSFITSHFPLHENSLTQVIVHKTITSLFVKHILRTSEDTTTQDEGNLNVKNDISLSKATEPE